MPQPFSLLKTTCVSICLRNSEKFLFFFPLFGKKVFSIKKLSLRWAICGLQFSACFSLLCHIWTWFFQKNILYKIIIISMLLFLIVCTLMIFWLFCFLTVSSIFMIEYYSWSAKTNFNWKIIKLFNGLFFLLKNI